MASRFARLNRGPLGRMSETISVHIDFVVEDRDGSYRLVLVEGPWEDPHDPHQLARLQKRVADCITAAINGHLAARYPTTDGRPLVIQIDSYDTPKERVDEMLATFQRQIEMSEDIQECIRTRRHVAGISLAHNWMDFDAEFARRSKLQERPGFFRRVLGKIRR
jgi:hypothetical protein